MAIKVIWEKQKRKEVVYPNIQVSEDTGLVILFLTESVGTVLHKGETDFWEGFHYDDWLMGGFKPLQGKLILENE